MHLQYMSRPPTPMHAAVQDQISPTLPTDISETVARALAEDIGPGDLTAELIPSGRRVRATLVTREPAVICGIAWFDEVFRQLDSSVQVLWRVHDGDNIRPEQELCVISGPARAMLTGERTALNFLQMLSGVATQTRKLAERIKGTKARILDTRKTLPGLRAAQKYAVVVGGGVNHRFGLYDAILIKENHILAAGGITELVKAALAHPSKAPVIVEVENLPELEEAFAAGAQHLLLDNFPAHNLVRAAQIAQHRRRVNLGPSLVEASGNISMANVRGIADSGADYISVGSLTKNITAVDLSLRLQPE